MAAKSEIIEALGKFRKLDSSTKGMLMKLSNEALQKALDAYRREQPEVESPTGVDIDRIKQDARAEAARIAEREREELRQQQLEVQREANWTDILRTWFGNRRLKNIMANRAPLELQAELENKPFNLAFLKKLLADDPKFANQLLWETVEPPVADVQLTKDRGVFDSVCRNRGLSNHTTGFNLVREALGPGFDSVAMERLLSSGKITLAPAREEDRSNWQSQHLQSAYERGDLAKLSELAKKAYYDQDPDVLETLKKIIQDTGKANKLNVLRALAKIQTEYHRATGQHVTGANHEAPSVNPAAPKSYNTSDLTPAAPVETGKLPLPASVTTEVLRRATGEEFKRFVRLYGNSAVAERYQGRN